MLATTVTVSGFAMAFGLMGLLMLGSKWLRTGFLRCLAYSLAIAGLAGLAAGLALEAGPGEIWIGSALAFLGALAAWALRRDWNPPAQALFGSLAVTCVLFAAYAGTFAFSQELPFLAYPANIVLVMFELAAFALLLIATHETLDTAARVRWHRRTGAHEVAGFTPFVSVHVPTHNEPPELVIETLAALRELDYPAFEVIVLDNNTEDPGLWRPVAHFCEQAGLRFVHLEDWPGYKAGALNHGLEICDPRTEVIAVVDADFVVTPDFLRHSVGQFADPRMGIVQTAQRFRPEDESGYLRRLGLTYRTFDEISMPSRNERNAIIFAGTMGLLRREALVAAGGWGEWCVTEDAELSLRILARGYDSIYIEEAFGSGVMPLTFAGLKRQRFRWCLGGIQLLRTHWRLLIRGKGCAPDGTPLSLTAGQRYDYMAASLQWFMPLLGIAFGFLLLTSVIAHAVGNDLALRPLAGPFVAVPMALLVTGVVRALWGLRARLPATRRDSAAVMGIFLGLSWAVALACVRGLSRGDSAFLRTPKFGERDSLLQTLRAARAETGLGLALVVAAVVAAVTWPTADAVFISLLCAWSALIFWCAPVTAIAAARMELGSEILRSRRRLDAERTRGSAGMRRVGYASALVTSLAIAALVVPGLASAPGGSLGDAFTDFDQENPGPPTTSQLQAPDSRGKRAGAFESSANPAPASAGIDPADAPQSPGVGGSDGQRSADSSAADSPANDSPATGSQPTDEPPSSPTASDPPSGGGSSAGDPPSSSPVDPPDGPPSDPSGSRPVDSPAPPDRPSSP